MLQEFLNKNGITTVNNIYIISPHIDDAIFSLGGLIAYSKNTFKYTIVNIFSVSNYVYGEVRNEVESTNVRKNEDINIQKKLKANIINLDYPEILVRNINITTDRIFLSSLNTFADSYLKDFHLYLEKITNDLLILVNKNDLLFVPLAHGSHIDHVLTREILKNFTACRIVFYTELPYGARERNSNIAKEFSKNLKSVVIKVPQTFIRKHIELCKEYKSQLLPKHEIEIYKYLSTNFYTLWIKE